MASVIDKCKVVAGRLVKVWNAARPKFSNSAKQYFAIWAEDADGKNERCLLFTETEIKNAEYRAQRNKEDLTKKDWFADLVD